MKPTQAQIEAAKGLDLLQNEMEYQRQINPSGTAAPAIEWAIDKIKALTAAAEVGEQSKECWVNETYLNNAIAATIERCAQVADNFQDRDIACSAIRPLIAAAIRNLKDTP